MASKEIRDWLDGLKSVQQGFDNVAAYQDKKEARDIRSQYLGDLPTKLGAAGATPEMSSLIQSQELANPGFASQYLLKQLSAKQKAGADAAPLSRGYLATAGVTNPKEQDDILSLPADKQMKGVDQRRNALDASRRGEDVFRKQKKNLGDNFIKIDKDFNKAFSDIDAVESFLKQGTIPADAGAAMFIGRQMQGGGVLTEQDVAPFKQRYGAGVVQGISNWATGNVETKISKEQGAALEEITKVLRKKLKSKADRDKVSVLNSAQLVAPDVGDAVDEIGLKQGFKKRTDGAWETSGETKKISGDYAKVIDGAKKAGRQDIIDRVMKAEAAGEPLPPMYLQKFGGQ